MSDEKKTSTDKTLKEETLEKISGGVNQKDATPGRNIYHRCRDCGHRQVEGGTCKNCGSGDLYVVSR